MQQELSQVMSVTPGGLLVYQGDSAIYLVVGGKDGQINLSKLP